MRVWAIGLGLVLTASLIFAFAQDTSLLQGRFKSAGGFVPSSSVTEIKPLAQKCVLMKGDEITGYQSYMLLPQPDWLVDARGGRHSDFTNIQDAIDAASEGDTIAVCPGEYTEDLVVDLSLNFIGLDDREKQEIIGHAEVDEVNSVAFSNFTFTGGSSDLGGAIYSEASTNTFANNSFEENVANVDGGAVHIDEGDTSFSSNQFLGNSSLGDAGAVLLGNGTHIFNENQFINNESVQLGAAIFIQGSNDFPMQFTSNFFQENVTQMSGAALYCNDCSDVSFESDVFDSNEADLAVVYLSNNAATNASLDLASVEFINNEVRSYVLGSELYDASISGSTFSSNTADWPGTPNEFLLSFTDAKVSIQGSSFDNNQSGVLMYVSDTGAIASELVNNTFYSNSVEHFLINYFVASSNPGIQFAFNTFVDNVSDSDVTIFKSAHTTIGTYTASMNGNLFHNNLNGSGLDAVCHDNGYGHFPSSTGSNSDSGSTCFDGTVAGDMINTAAVFSGAYGNYGGSTDTLPLAASAPQVDAAQCDASLREDQRGYPRPALGNTCDIGAYEY